jgi:hypothetical protein
MNNGERHIVHCLIVSLLIEIYHADNSRHIQLE